MHRRGTTARRAKPAETRRCHSTAEAGANAVTEPCSAITTADNGPDNSPASPRGRTTAAGIGRDQGRHRDHYPSAIPRGPSDTSAQVRFNADETLRSSRLRGSTTGFGAATT